jgi:hypothetical protein
MDIHLKRFLWYYKTITNKDFPTENEEIIVSHDLIILAGLDYWKFIYTIRRLVEEGYLKKNFRRRYVITKKLVEALSNFLPVDVVNFNDKMNKAFIYLTLALLGNRDLREKIMMTLGASDEKELAELIKKFYETTQALNEKMGVVLRKIEELREEIRKYVGQVSSVSEDGEIGRIVVDQK